MATFRAELASTGLLGSTGPTGRAVADYSTVLEYHLLPTRLYSSRQ